ncbi:MAG: fumarylacetoacetate hydrolase family protein [Chloroflexi bacterium]|nr:fumarylacetoacetate hydrolase family protein [Chloroflexota bacterium]
MKLVQFWRPNLGYRVGLVRNENVIDITMPDVGLKSTNDFIENAAAGGFTLAEFVEQVLNAQPRAVYAWSELDTPRDMYAPHLALPLLPPEVWGAGVTYQRSAEFRSSEVSKTNETIYDQAHRAPRPEIFFKATATRCVGPNQPLGVRRDSHFTAPEPELALVLGHRGEIVAFTIANDVSAWDIERENPLYLPQSKIFRGACALGPSIVTPDELPNPYEVEIHCRVVRQSETIFQETSTTALLKRTFDELLEYLLCDNPVPGASVLCTGAGIIVPPECALREGDVVEIEIPPIGVLRNPVQEWGKR